VVINANNCPINIASGAPGVAGMLTINSGTVSVAAGATAPLSLGLQTGNVGTANLNGGTLSVAQIVKGDPGASATNNFNGGTLSAVNANFGSNFMAGLDRANVRNGGAVVDSGGFAIAIGQALEHSNIGGDNPTDGGLTKIGTGTLALGGISTYTGPTTVSNGTLLVNGSISGSAVSVLSGAVLGGTGTVGPAVTVNAGGTLAPGASIGTLTFNGDLSLNGNLAIEVNTSASPSNDFCNVAGALSASAGTVTVTNIGPTPLNAGDSFTLFNKPVSNGGALVITPAPGNGLGWTNKLAIDGSIAVVTTSSTAGYPTNMTFSLSGNTLSLGWPATHLGWLAQSNSVSVANSNAWFDIANSASATNLSITINPALPKVFYRLRHP
jgi:autotransporter-associated beta strand protein